MNPFQKNKVDISGLSAEEQRVFRMYGKLPDKKDLFKNKLQERKYFDSGDYAMSKAGKASEGGVTSIGREHPVPENIPHLSSPGPSGSVAGVGNVSSSSAAGGASVASGSPVKESSFLQRETTADSASTPSLSSNRENPPPR